MQIIILSKVIIPEDPVLMDLALKIFKGEKYFKPVVQENKLSQEQAEELSRIITDLRKMQRLPVDKILQTLDEISKDPVFMAKRKNRFKYIAEKLGLGYEEVVWILRRRRPETPIEVTPLETKKIIEYREKGLNNNEISKRMQIQDHAIVRVLNEEKPELIKKQLSPQFWDGVYKEFMVLKNEGKAYEEIVQFLIEKYKVDRDNLYGMLHRRGFRADLYAEITSEEKELIIEKVHSGESINQIAKELNRSNSTIRDIIQRDDKVFYNENIKSKAIIIPTSILNFIYKEIEKELYSIEGGVFIKHSVINQAEIWL
jgi:hypothetical protein